MIGAAIASSASASMKLQIQPIRLEIEAGRAGSFLLVNHHEHPVLLEARAFSWRQRENGVDELEPTRDIVLTPPIMRIAPGARQTIRLALRPDAQTALDTEAPYRLMLEELPSGDEPPGVNLRLRYLMPIFVRNGAVTAGPVSLRVVGEGAACRIVAKNAGSRHIRIESMQVNVSEKAVDVEAPLYVLAGMQLALACPVEATSHRRVKGIRLESDAGVFTDAGGADGVPHP